MSNQHLDHEHAQPDSWHRHTPDEGGWQEEHGAHASPKALAMTFVAMVLGVVFTVVVLIVFFENYTSKFKVSVEETTEIGELARLDKSKALGRLNQGGWLDSDSVQIPIDRAMERVVAKRAISSD